jgi:hypothetical protein
MDMNGTDSLSVETPPNDRNAITAIASVSASRKKLFLSLIATGFIS